MPPFANFYLKSGSVRVAVDDGSCGTRGVAEIPVVDGSSQVDEHQIGYSMPPEDSRV